MKSTFSRMVAVALTMGLGFAAGAANAVPLTFNGWVPNIGGFITIFGDGSVTPGVAPFSFNDLLSFTVPPTSTGNGGAGVFSNVSSTGTNIVFDRFTLSDSVNSISASGGTGLPLSFLSFIGGGVPGNYSLTISGHELNAGLPGGYAGTVTVQAVPEPETYAMMLAGLGLLGFSARRRNNNT